MRHPQGLERDSPDPFLIVKLQRGIFSKMTRSYIHNIWKKTKSWLFYTLTYYHMYNVHYANLQVCFKLHFEYTHIRVLCTFYVYFKINSVFYTFLCFLKINIVSGAGVYRFCSLNVAARIWPQRVAYSIIQVPYK